jgi:hypothetical protein
MRARWLANGGPATPQEFSGALNVATNCTDTTMPYSYAMPAADRREGWRHGLDGVADSVFAPFSREGVLQTALAHDCLLWPGDPAPAANSTAPVPDVPAIVLTGRLDTRTPVESARRTAALFPRGTVVEVPGTGHDILDSDITGCAFKALGRWVAGRPVGRPCRGQSNQVPPYARSPRHLRQFRSAPGVGGPRGRVVFATLDTVADAQVTALETLYAGFLRLRGGGLRGGSFDAPDTLDSIRLDDYALVQGVEVTGRLSILDGGATTGSVRVDGPGRLDGRLRLDRRGGVRGTLAGRAVRYRPKRAGAAAVGSGRAPRSVAALWPSARALARAAARSRGSAAPRP